MAEMKIVVQKIDRIEPHENADRLEVAFTDIYDWPVIISKDSMKVGDKVIHFPVDCVISLELGEILLGGSRLKLKNGRIRAAKIRGIVSYGILASYDKLNKLLSIPENSRDLMGILEWKKYEPPKRKDKNITGKKQGKKSWKRDNRNFDKYMNMNHLQNCRGIFDDYVFITEKLHGTSFRAGWVKRDVVTFWDKLKLYIGSFFNKDYEWEFVWGSRNVQKQTAKGSGFYEEDVWTKMVTKYNLKNKIPKNTVIYGEIVGPGIQKNTLKNMNYLFMILKKIMSTSLQGKSMIL